LAGSSTAPRTGCARSTRGGIDGFLSYNAIYPASGEHVIVLANSEATPVQAIAATLAHLTLRAPRWQPARAPAAVSR
jgi:hypothetical protein